ncbi:hypothetical protein F9K33_09820 [bacterium]|nr:MAG: hypothetical protein F9K33_09820 [bacterium]
MSSKYLFLLLILSACVAKKEAAVSRISETGKMPLSLELSSLAGTREGYHAHAVLTFVDTVSRDSLIIRFTLEPGVPTKFVSGEYTWNRLSGEVTCTSIDFFGGQGGVPSIGGNFDFYTSDGEKYTVYLPTTEMKIKK